MEVAVTVQRGIKRPYYLATWGLKPSSVYVQNGISTNPSTEMRFGGIKDTDGNSFEETRSLEQELTFSVAEKSFETEMLPLTHLKIQTLGVTNCGRHLLYMRDRNTQKYPAKL